jgi:SAM-dependent methyltransferase
MNEVFGDHYAAAYDALYADKDYRAECDILDEVLGRAVKTVQSILDLGCGTGRHSVELARRGYEIVGVDLSEGMLGLARQRSISDGVEATFVLGDIRNVQLGRRFDAVLSMFAVVGYQTSDADLRATFENVRGHLAPGGIFVFDVWYAPAVLAVGPSTRVKAVPTEDGEIERRAVGILDPEQRVCTVRYELTRRPADGSSTTTYETHRMRYFDERELDALLAGSGLALRSVSAFPDVEHEPSVESWNVLVVASS